MIQTYAAHYIAHGWRVIVLRPADKVPAAGRDWPNHPAAPADFGPTSNIGLVLGEPSGGIVDIDLDCDEARALAPRILPLTATFGRPSTPRAHYIYRAPGLRTRKPTGAHVELRSNTTTGSGAQTMIPPSVHPAGELLTWTDPAIPVAQVPPRDLERAFVRLALATILTRRWPTLVRDRAVHHTVLALAGALRRAGWPEDDLHDFIDLLPPPQDGNTDEHRHHAIASTYTRDLEDDAVTGWPRLEVALGTSIASFRSLAQDPALGYTRPATITLAQDHEPLSDLGNASRLLAAHGHSLRFAPGLGWLRWSGSRWTTGDPPWPEAEAVARDLCATPGDGEVAKRLRKHGEATGSAARLQGMITVASHRPQVRIDPQDVDADPLLLGCPNGTIDLRTGLLRPADPADLITKQTRIPFDPHAPPPVRFVQFLRETQPDAPTAEYLVRWLGYCLTGDTREHAFNAWHGASGRNGKGTLMRVIQHVWGDYATTIAPEVLLQSSTPQHSTGLTDFRGARVGITNEAPTTGRRWNEDTIKWLTGGDTIKARRMREDNAEWRPTHKIIIAMNARPLVRDQGPAFWARVHLVPWEVSFLGREDRTLDQALEQEAPGILALLVRGALAWQHHGLCPTAPMLAALEDYRRSQDTLGAFLDEATEADPDGSIPRSELFKSYQRWADDQGERYPLAAQAFYRVLAERNYKIGKGGRRAIKGIKWRRKK